MGDGKKLKEILDSKGTIKVKTYVQSTHNKKLDNR